MPAHSGAGTIELLDKWKILETNRLFDLITLSLSISCGGEGRESNPLEPILVIG
jgi:hypothetical protein